MKDKTIFEKISNDSDLLHFIYRKCFAILYPTLVLITILPLLLILAINTKLTDFIVISSLSILLSYCTFFQIMKLLSKLDKMRFENAKNKK